MAPVVGVTVRTRHLRSAGRERPAETVARAYVEALEEAGALPVLLPNTNEPARAGEYLERIDALLLTGGDDPDPRLFDESPHPRVETVDLRRDRFEIALVRGAHERDLPTFAVCRGIQIANIALGGDIWQDVGAQTESTVQHVQRTLDDGTWHEIEIRPGSLLARIWGCERTWVNSFHHQACRRLGGGLVVSATCAGDGLVEALEEPGRRFWLGVQWHPEVARAAGDAASAALFAAFVEAARRDPAASSKD